MQGIRAAHSIRAEHPLTGIVILSQHAHEAYAFALLQHRTAGLGHLLKERVLDRDELVAALRETAAGRSVLDPLVVDALVHRRARLERRPLNTLNDRELRVLSLMAQGKTNAGIAKEMHLSESAIEKPINAMFGKLGLSLKKHKHSGVSRRWSHSYDRQHSNPPRPRRMTIDEPPTSGTSDSPA
jgi:DNA-binding NarL/FixJ family response regulator